MKGDDTMGTVLIYVTMFMFSIIPIYVYDNIPIKNKSIATKFIFLILVILPLIIISTMRSGVGADYYHYESAYNGIVGYFDSGKTVLESKTTEPLFLATEYISYLLGHSNFQILLGFTSIFTVTPVVIFIMEEVKEGNKALSLFIYIFIFFLISFNAIRQMIAISLIIYSFKYIINSNIVKYFITVIIATLFHNTAIIALLFFFLKGKIKFKYKYSKKQWVLIILYLLLPVLLFFVWIFGSQIPLIGTYFQYYTPSVNNFNLSRVFTLISIILPVIPLLFFKEEIYRMKKGDVFLNILLFSFPIIIVSFFYQWTFRLLYFTTSPILIIYPGLINSYTKNGKFLKLFTYFYMFILFLLIYFILESHGVNNYEWILF